MKQDDFDIPEVFRRAMEEAGWRGEQEEGGGGNRPPRRPFPSPRRSPRVNRLAVIAILVLLLLFSLGSIASFYTDLLWFDHLGFRAMFVKRLTVRGVVFAGAFVVAAAVLLGNWLLARRRALAEASPLSPQLLRSGGARGLIIGAGLVLAFLFASAAASLWEELLLLLNAQSFGVTEPIFGRDVGFYVFQLPVYEFVRGWLIALLIVAVGGLLPIYAGSNLLEMQRGTWRPLTSNALRRHLAVLGGLLLLVWAAGYGLDIFRLLYSSRGVAFGASYTDLRANLWALRLQMAFMTLTALAVFANYFRPNVRLPILTGALWLLSIFVIGGLLPGVFQRYVVEPNELTLETPYIEHNIEFTRRAFGLDQIETIPFGTVRDLSPEDLLENEEVLRNIRLWDYRPLQQTYQQLQGLRPYYEMGEIDIDRYEIDGQQRQVMLAARELNKDKLPAPSWVNRNLEFTHGYGIVMNPVNEVTPEGQPNFFIKDFPPQSRVSIEVTQPEIYYGELTRDTVYVGSSREEFNYPSGDENVYTSYTGRGGVLLDSYLKRLAFAMRQSDPNVLLSDDITESTRVQYRRQIQDRVRELTPFLMLDADPYLVVDSAGRLIWIQDAYTISDDYPYSTPARITTRPTVAEATPTGTTLPETTRTLNYIRNSVKVTIDAYNGTVNYYVTDPDDPIIRSYSSAFPGVFQPLEEMPADLREHLRYPVDLFWVQARQHLTYHMSDVRAFYNKEDLWQIPTEVLNSSQQETEPYYVTLPLPGSREPEYLLILPLSPATKNNMIAWMAARNDPGHYGELIVYELPKQNLIFGPLQVEGRIDQEPSISQQFTLWDQRGSSVIRGNLLVLPINQSFLYVEPIYLISDASALPELRRIVTASNTSVAMAETLDRSLVALASGTPAASPVTGVLQPEAGESDVGAAATPASAATPLANPTTLDELVAAANAHLAAAEQAQRQGDWTSYGQELQALRQTLAQLAELTGQSE
ncbi:UPF0182 family protein [Promineifilum sp.]|uniref:UPF0182 family membrane protein n=1 Tax=Promineifilum sp. TaxID=2664178 RepID=UPI0035B11DB7